MNARSSAALSSMARLGAVGSFAGDDDRTLRGGVESGHRRMLELLRRHGTHAHSFLALRNENRVWFGGDGGVTYSDRGASWVVATAPVAPSDGLERTTMAFLRYAGEHRARVCFFAMEQHARDALGLKAHLIGEQPVWDPARWPEVLASSRSLREQLRRARAKGVRVRELAPEQMTDEHGAVARAMSALRQEWLESRRMAPMGFLLGASPQWSVREQRRWVAERQGEVVAFLAATPVFGRDGWLLDNVIRGKAAPNGATELLIDAAMRALASEGYGFATMGLAPLRGSVPGWLRLAGKLARPLYDFDGLSAFKSRLRPNRWEPVYLAYPPHRTALGAMWDAVQPFASEGPLSFALNTLSRRAFWAHWASSLVTALAVLLRRLSPSWPHSPGKSRA